MILWCAYCQKFAGEKTPFDDFSLTHGLCQTCAAKNVFDNPPNQAKLVSLVALHRDLLRTGSTEDLAQAPQLLARAVALGIEPVDLLVGIIQPSLYEIGHLWAKGKITVAAEHRFTAFCTKVVELVYAHYQLRPMPPAPTFLLMSADGNFHSLGLRIVELMLRKKGIATLAVFPGLPPEEAVNLAIATRARVVGFSVALPDQMAGVQRFLSELQRRKLQYSPQICVGGPALRMEIPRPSNDILWGTTPFGLID